MIDIDDYIDWEKWVLSKVSSYSKWGNSYGDHPCYRLDKSECDPDSGFLTSSNYELLTFINYNNFFDFFWQKK